MGVLLTCKFCGKNVERSIFIKAPSCFDCKKANRRLKDEERRSAKEIRVCFFCGNIFEEYHSSETKSCESCRKIPGKMRIRKKPQSDSRRD